MGKYLFVTYFPSLFAAYDDLQYLIFPFTIGGSPDKMCQDPWYNGVYG